MVTEPGLSTDPEFTEERQVGFQEGRVDSVLSVSGLCALCDEILSERLKKSEVLAVTGY